MSAKLIVHNIPPSMPIEEVSTHFKPFKGFNNASFLYSDDNGMLVSQIDFMNFEFADHAKKVMQNFQFPNHQMHQGIVIEFMKPEYIDNNFHPGGNKIQGEHNFQQNNNRMPFFPNNENEMDAPSKMFNPFLDKLNRFNNFENPEFGMQPPIQNFPNKPPGGFINNMPPPNSNPMPSNMPNMKMNAGFMGPEFNSNPNLPMGGPLAPNNPMYNDINPASKAAIASLGNNFVPIQANAASNNSSIALFKIPSSATNSLYVDGIPFDSTEREVAHIFRPFPGFQSVRLLPKKTKSGREFYLCFVDFENSLQSTIALNTLQEYRFSKKDKKGLRISYASEPREKKSKKDFK